MSIDKSEVLVLMIMIAWIVAVFLAVLMFVTGCGDVTQSVGVGQDNASGLNDVNRSLNPDNSTDNANNNTAQPTQ